jgi:hypothetical protein
MEPKDSGSEKTLRREKKDAKETGTATPKARPGPSAVSGKVCPTCCFYLYFHILCLIVYHMSLFILMIERLSSEISAKYV